MTTQIEYLDRDAATVTTHDLQVAAYIEPWRPTIHERPIPITVSDLRSRLADAKKALAIAQAIIAEVDKDLT